MKIRSTTAAILLAGLAVLGVAGNAAADDGFYTTGETLVSTGGNVVRDISSTAWLDD
ncbi:hypothetical protein [Streptomyces tsukubensis]|uniref:hypothetical protein n=1 Tax=Streptomyces tsukubensis TaxID=83656 RepID=UPI0015C3031B|nr:hypothetical protein [Streptomyces tsukubensis]